MKTVTRAQLLSKPEVQEAIDATSRLLRNTLVELGFGAFEEAALMLADEAVRAALESELQKVADDFGDAGVVDGREYKRHEPGEVIVHSLCGGPPREPVHVS